MTTAAEETIADRARALGELVTSEASRHFGCGDLYVAPVEHNPGTMVVVDDEHVIARLPIAYCSTVVVLAIFSAHRNGVRRGQDAGRYGLQHELRVLLDVAHPPMAGDR
jgi:hypothetical protein